VKQRLQSTIAARKGLLVFLLKYGLGFGLLAYVIWDNRAELGNALDKPWHLAPFAAAIVIYLIGILITFYRWYVLVRAQDLPFSLPDGLRLGLVGFYVSTFLPGSVGGDLIKAAFIARSQSRRTVAVATVVIDRVIGLVGLFWLVALVGGVAWLGGFMADVTSHPPAVAALETIVFTALLITAASFATWFVAGFVADDKAARFARGLERIPKVGMQFAELWRALYLYRRRGKAVLGTVLMSMVGHVCFVLGYFYAALTLSTPDQVPTMAAHFLFVPVGMIITAGFPAPGGVGGAEFGFGKLYEIVGYPAVNGVLGMLVQRVIVWVLALSGYVVYLRMRPSLPQRPTLTVEPAAPEAEPPATEPAAVTADVER
jgi:uncharacterized membrane protein YbhN (UPF0104 family)